MRFPTGMRAGAAGLTVCLAATTALAQDYVATRVDDVYVEPPVSATNLALDTADITEVQLPFPFSYYGTLYDSVWVGANGYLTFDPVLNPTRSYPPGRFPPPNSDTNLGQFLDGSLGVWWGALDQDNGGDVVMHVVGTAPDRELVVTWLASTLRAGDADLSFQARLGEGNGLVELGYKPDTVPSTWPADDTVPIGEHAIGVTAPGFDDTRFLIPPGVSREPRQNYGHPGQDVRFVPRATQFEGRLLMDVLVSDATGVGNSLREDVPVRNTEIALFWGTNTSNEAARASTDDEGNFSFTAYGLPSDGSATGTLRVYTATHAAVARRESGGDRFELDVEFDIAFDSDQDLGDILIDANNDPDAAFRAPLHVTQRITAVCDWVSEHSSDTIEKLEVLFDPDSSETTAYTAADGGTPASLRIASAESGNADPWDDGIVEKTYGRHVLAEISALPSTSADATFDGVSDVENAFAEAFGYYLHTAVSGASAVHDGVDENTTTTFDLEDPQASTPRAPDVTAWVAATLHDLADGAGTESEDRVDGGLAGSLERPLQMVDALTSATDVDAFYRGWGHATLDAQGLARLTIHNGLVPDDASEPNDLPDEAADVGNLPFLVEDRTLNPYDEDWFEFALDAAADSVLLEVLLAEPLLPEHVVVELRSSADALLATAVVDEQVGQLLVATAGSLPAGTYRARVRHVAGTESGAYGVQAFLPLALSALPLRDWTVGQPYDESVGSAGGVPPLTLTREGADGLPPGLSIRDGVDRIGGTPITAGTFPVRLRLDDSGVPAHRTSSIDTIVINPPLVVELGEFLAFPVGAPFAIERLDPGGTAPRTFSVSSGTLPAGLALSSSELRLSGTVAAAGSTPVSIDGIDAAGSDDEVESTIVGCVAGAKKVVLDLDAGKSACGFHFDAVAGSTATFQVKTAKKQTKRLLTPIVIGPDGRPVADVKLKGKKGAALAKNVQCTETGRYFVVFSSDEGEATQLQIATYKVKLPKGDDERQEEFEPGDFIDIPIGGLSGSKLRNFKVTVDRRSGLTLGITLIRPDLTTVSRDAYELKEKGRSTSFSYEFDQAGTWTVRITGASGALGSLKYRYKLKHPKREAFSLE